MRNRLFFALVLLASCKHYTGAAPEGFAAFDKDDDFRALVDRLGPPPKLVFVRLGNAAT